MTFFSNGQEKKVKLNYYAGVAVMKLRFASQRVVSYNSDFGTIMEYNQRIIGIESVLLGGDHVLYAPYCDSLRAFKAGLE